MATMIPWLTEAQLDALDSEGEAIFYRVCRDQLPNDMVVLHSVSWTFRKKGQTKPTVGEADFVILSDKQGLLSLEVKGGGISFEAETGTWWSKAKSNVVYKIKDPFKQAKTERYSLKECIFDHSLWRYWRGKQLNTAYAVVFPDIADATPLLSPDRDKRFIGVSGDLLNCLGWYESVMEFWKDSSQNPLGEDGVKLVKEILRPPVDVEPVLRSTVDIVEQQRIRLTDNQKKVLRVIGDRTRAVISGGAGTGKTILAVEKAKSLAGLGLRTLILCYNRPLADVLAESLKGEPLTVLIFHQLCDKHITLAWQGGYTLMQEAQEAYPGNSDRHRFDVLMPHALALSADALPEERYDAIVVDEAQDFSEMYWFAVESLLRDQEKSYLYAFTDENQTLYPRKSAIPVHERTFNLTENCRNTTAIHQLGYRYYRGDVEIDPPGLQGPEVSYSSFDLNNEQAKAVTGQVYDWIVNQELSPTDVVVLIAKQPKAPLHQLLMQKKQAGFNWAIEEHGTNNVLVDTVARFKGLEAQAVVLWIGDEIITDERWEALYVGATRAKSLLHIVGSFRAVKHLQASDYPKLDTNESPIG